jgi:arylsulfatase A-like enzyme
MPLIWKVPGVTLPGGVSQRTVDLMSVYPTLCDLAKIPLPDHVEGKSIVSLLRDPAAPWDSPAITTHGFKNHTVRTEGFRYIRYADGGEELYDEAADPYEWTNLADDPGHDAVKKELARWLPQHNAPEKPKKKPATKKPSSQAKRKTSG